MQLLSYKFVNQISSIILRTSSINFGWMDDSKYPSEWWKELLYSPFQTIGKDIKV
jgi:hypothetical protein